MKQKHHINKEGYKMAAFTKPSVFEVTVNNKNKTDIEKNISETRLTKEFFDECARIAKKFRKDYPNNK